MYFKYFNQPRFYTIFYRILQKILLPVNSVNKETRDRIFIKCQTTKIYHKLTQRKWSEVLYPVKSKSLIHPDFPSGLKGRELQLFSVSFTPLHPWESVSQWLPCLRLCWGDGGSPRVHGSISSLRAIKDKLCWVHGQAALEGLFESLPLGHAACKEVKVIHMLCAMWEESCWLLGPEKQSGGFLRAKGRGVTWGWCVHELSTALVQIPDLNIGPGHCQLSSVTWTPRGSSYGQHPSCCSLACVKQLLTHGPCCWDSQPSTLLTAGDALTAPSCSHHEPVSVSRGCLA